MKKLPICPPRYILGILLYVLYIFECMLNSRSIQDIFHFSACPRFVGALTYEPRHDKTCLWEFPTRPDTNQPAQPQKLARVLKFRL